MLWILAIGAVLTVGAVIAAARGHVPWTMPATMTVVTAVLVAAGSLFAWHLIITLLAIVIAVVLLIVMFIASWRVMWAMLVIAALTFGVTSWAIWSSDNATASPTTTETDITFRPGVDTVPVEARCTTNAFVDHSIRTVEVGNLQRRQASTDVSIPFVGKTDAEVSNEISAEVCGNPTYLLMIAKDILLWDVSIPGVEANKPWVQGIVDQINASGLDSFAGKVGNPSKEVVTAQFQKWAGWLNTVLLNFDPDGLHSTTSGRNWELPAVRDPRTLPVAQLATEQESKPSWERTLRTKVGTCLMVIGFNAEDRRLESFGCKLVPPTTPPKTTVPPGTPPRVPPKEVCPPGTTGTPPNCLESKNHRNDVTPPQGVTPQPAGKYEPTAPAAPAAPLNPAVPAHSDSGTSAPVQGATPAPSPSIPVTDPTVAPAPSAPATNPVTDPDAG